MSICANCDHSILCPSWGEYKCEKKQQRVKLSKKACEDFKPYTKRKDKKCHCFTCMAEGYVNDDQ